MPAPDISGTGRKFQLNRQLLRLDCEMNYEVTPKLARIISH